MEDLKQENDEELCEFKIVDCYSLSCVSSGQTSSSDACECDCEVKMKSLTDVKQEPADVNNSTSLNLLSDESHDVDTFSVCGQHSTKFEIKQEPRDDCEGL